MANYDYILKMGGNTDALFKEVVKKPCYLKVIYFDDTYDIFNLKFR